MREACRESINVCTLFVFIACVAVSPVSRAENFDSDAAYDIFNASGFTTRIVTNRSTMGGTWSDSSHPANGWVPPQRPPTVLSRRSETQPRWSSDSGYSPSEGSHQGSGESGSDRGQNSPPSARPQYSPDLGSHLDTNSALQLISFPAQKKASGNSLLADIRSHLHAKFGSQYEDRDLITAAHETSHGIHSDLRNRFAPRGRTVNGFYLLNNQAAFVDEPRVGKSQAAAFVPRSLRHPRFNTYVTGASSWEKSPLYLWDEWNSYINGTLAGIDLYKRGQWRGGNRIAADGPMEMTPYAIALAMAVAKKDPRFFQNNTQFREFLKFNVERAVNTFIEVSRIGSFQSPLAMNVWNDLRHGSDSANMRNFLANTYGEDWVRRVLYLQ